MFVFGSVWDYLLYNSIVNNPIGFLYIIGLVVYTVLIVIWLSGAADKINWFKKRQNSRIFISILILLSIVLGHIATVLTGKLISVLI